MIIPIGGDVYVNVSHISIMSGIQKVPNQPNTFQVRLVLMGSHEHIAVGTEEAMRALHSRVKNALDQLGS